MEYKVFTPSPQLKDLVQCFWALESTRDEITPKDYFLMADSCLEIIFQHNGGFRNYSAQSARIRFQHSIHDRFTVGNKVGFFGVRLYPHAVSQLLKMPASEVANDVFDFSAFFGRQGTDLADQVYGSLNTLERIDRVSGFLIKRAALNLVDPINYFVNKVIKNAGHVNISGMQQESGLSVKQFERRFKAIAGFPPKYFARIVRFQGIKDRYSSSRFQSMTSLAYSCNYYDQSHFNREFKEFSGVQPLQYFKLPLQENTGFSMPKENYINAGVQHRFDGYLPCGWFV